MPTSGWKIRWAKLRWHLVICIIVLHLHENIPFKPLEMVPASHPGAQKPWYVEGYRLRWPHCWFRKILHYQVLIASSHITRLIADLYNKCTFLLLRNFVRISTCEQFLISGDDRWVGLCNKCEHDMTANSACNMSVPNRAGNDSSCTVEFLWTLTVCSMYYVLLFFFRFYNWTDYVRAGRSVQINRLNIVIQVLSLQF